MRRAEKQGVQAEVKKTLAVRLGARETQNLVDRFSDLVGGNGSGSSRSSDEKSGLLPTARLPTVTLGPALREYSRTAISARESSTREPSIMFHRFDQ